jgi:SAM-dependent methyltransferase
VRTSYRECNYDLIAEWYDRWYENLWKKEEPFKTIETYGREEYPTVFHDDTPNIRVLDCACGTGNSYVAFHQAGYNVFGTDGSGAMLAKAKENCEKEGIDHANIIEHPINWKDLDAYKRHLIDRFDGNGFDVIVNLSNSFCHIPPTEDYMTLALENFKALLNPGGLLFSRVTSFPPFFRVFGAAQMVGDPLRGEPVEFV